MRRALFLSSAALVLSAALSAATAADVKTAGASVTATGTVTAIDAAQRRVTVRNAEGVETAFTVDPSVQKLDTVKVGTGMRIAAPLPGDCELGDTVQLSVRPEKIAVDEDIEEGMVSMSGRVASRIYHGVNTQITVDLGEGAHLVALEQQTYTASADDRWEEGMAVRLGWHPENCLVLR